MATSGGIVGKQVGKFWRQNERKTSSELAQRSLHFTSRTELRPNWITQAGGGTDAHENESFLPRFPKKEQGSRPSPLAQIWVCSGCAFPHWRRHSYTASLMFKSQSLTQGTGSPFVVVLAGSTGKQVGVGNARFKSAFSLHRI